MALLKTNHTFRGTFGGVYFKRDSSGQHIQSMPRYITRHKSPGYALRLLAWTALFTYWKIISSLIVIGYWTNFAAQYYFLRKNGTLCRLSNSQWFAHFNINRMVENLPPYSHPPRGPNDLPDFTALGKRLYMQTGPPDNTTVPYTGNFYEDGFYNFQHQYTMSQEKLHIWYDGNKWIISYFPGNKDPNQFWTRFGDGVEGIYIADNPNEGDITVFI